MEDGRRCRFYFFKCEIKYGGKSGGTHSLITAKLISNNRSIWQRLGIFIVMWRDALCDSNVRSFASFCRLFLSISHSPIEYEIDSGVRKLTLILLYFQPRRYFRIDFAVEFINRERENNIDRRWRFCELCLQVTSFLFPFHSESRRMKLLIDFQTIWLKHFRVRWKFKIIENESNVRNECLKRNLLLSCRLPMHKCADIMSESWNGIHKVINLHMNYLPSTIQRPMSNSTTRCIAISTRTKPIDDNNRNRIQLVARECRAQYSYAAFSVHVSHVLCTLSSVG